ncbi:MAG: peptidoglycan DD-metalloendopeptidase family protein [Anaerolineae bacterium]|jgi:murein DD-endopeptidase MepM/ murein hydrolase activator NlpD|nr:peptidoglycan DD-metalloendopeptidase family protein [Anaerolineae bacterium]
MFQEPPVQPDDTRPTTTVPVVNAEGLPASPQPGGSRWLGLLSVLGAFGFTAATILVLLSGGSTSAPAPESDNNGVSVAQVTAAPSNTPAPTITPSEAEPTAEQADTQPQPVIGMPQIVPTMDGSTLVMLLSEPVAAVGGPNPELISRGSLDPFTIIPDRPRNQIIEYVIERGDTVYTIAQKFGLTQESIAWSNDRRQLWTLVPGSILYIPPVDGVVHIVAGEDTIDEIADFYGVEDALVVIDNEFNQLRGYTPDTTPPSGMRIFIPGGTGENIDWAPPVVVTSGGGGSGPGAPPNTVSFDPSSPGSCGAQPIGAGSGWVRPINNYTVTRGYADWHPGIDLAANPGTPVFAANSGTVIFAGWSNFGYGNAIVISSGPFQTVYAHLSAVNVRCGNTVVAGQPIGGVGSTGNSSGPHLHFEIISNGFRGNPTATIAF